MRRPDSSGMINWVTCLVVIWALFGLLYTPYPPGAQAFREIALSGPGLAHLFGVDPLGRDLFSRLWRGAGNTTAMALAAMGVSIFLSACLLAVAESGKGPLRRMVDSIVGLWVAVPVVFIGLLLLVVASPSPGSLIVAAALGNVPLAYRQLNVLWRQQIGAQYVEASVVLGARGWELFARTLWPNLRPDLLALARLVFAVSALELSGLAFLGLIGDPDFPELGAILRQHQADWHRAPGLVIWPGLMLSGLLMLVHLSGDEGN